MDWVTITIAFFRVKTPIEKEHRPSRVWRRANRPVKVVLNEIAGGSYTLLANVSHNTTTTGAGRPLIELPA